MNILLKGESGKKITTTTRAKEELELPKVLVSSSSPD